MIKPIAAWSKISKIQTVSMGGLLTKARGSAVDFDLMEWIKQNKPAFIKRSGDCLEWQSTVQNNNPRICIKKKSYWPRSATYEAHYKTKVTNRNILMECGNVRCLNPKHMTLTKKTNRANFYSSGVFDNEVPQRLKGMLKELFQKWPEHINRDGQCYIWKKTFSGSSPVLYKDNQSTMLRSRIYADYNSEFDKRRYVVRITCNDNACLNPAHFELVPKWQSLIEFKESGQVHDLKHCLIRTLNHQSRKLSFNDVAEIRNSNDKTGQLAQRFNVHVRTIQKIRNYSRFKIIPTAFGLLKVA